MLNAFFYLTMFLFLLVCLILILLILIQKGRGGGLASAFGGGGGNTAFGSKTGDVLTWATSIVFGVFLILAVALNLLANQVGAPPSSAIGAGTNVLEPTEAPEETSTTQPSTQLLPTNNTTESAAAQSAVPQMAVPATTLPAPVEAPTTQQTH